MKTVKEFIQKYLHDDDVTVLYVNMERADKTETFSFEKEGVTLPDFDTAIKLFGNLPCFNENKSGYVIECDVL